MNIDETLQIESNSSENTLELAAKIGSKLKGGEVIELVSDLGGGKTVFVRGLAKGMGSTDRVSSPTFTISREYKSGDLELHHFDFYRLAEVGAGVVADELAESIENPRIAVAIEWSSSVHHILPEDRLRVEIIKIGSKSRRVILKTSSIYSYLLDTLRPKRLDGN